MSKPQVQIKNWQFHRSKLGSTVWNYFKSVICHPKSWQIMSIISPLKLKMCIVMWESGKSTQYYTFGNPACRHNKKVVLLLFPYNYSFIPCVICWSQHEQQPAAKTSQGINSFGIFHCKIHPIQRSTLFITECQKTIKDKPSLWKLI